MAQETINGIGVLFLDDVGATLSQEADALDLIGQTYGQDVEAIVVPISRFAPEFFDLSTRQAGLFIQKLQNYRLRLVILGDIAPQMATSKSLTDFVGETNRIGHHLFVPDLARLKSRLSRV